MAETTFDQEKFNLEVRKFLKKVGVNSQREIERAVGEAMKSGRVKGGDRVKAQMTLSIPGVNLSFRIDDEIVLG